MYYLGLDIGSSSIKVALVDEKTGKALGVVSEPSQEMAMSVPQTGWAEQDPDLWWQYVCQGIQKLMGQLQIEGGQINGIGIAYQMHGLVLVDAQGKVLRDAIIWCDSRAVELGDRAYHDIGSEVCDRHLLNSPGNFTASKLKWVKENEPEIFAQIAKCMLPGDYIAYRLSGKIQTSASGLSEGTLWDFKQDAPAQILLDHYKISKELLPELVPGYGVQSDVSETGGAESGLAAGTPILYRAGDQPNNALSLNVFQPGEVALTAGTSGVVYAVTDNTQIQETQRVNNFAHINHGLEGPRIGRLLCINGTGIQYRWLKDNLAVGSYTEMNQLAESVPVGSEGVVILPFGNGAERMLYNSEIGQRLLHVNFNVHNKAHLCRAALEGIAFSFVYGMEIMQQEGMPITLMRAGNDNLFQAKVFAQTLCNLIGHSIEIHDTTGAIGAAQACVLHAGGYRAFESYTSKNNHIATITPSKDVADYQKAYAAWKRELELVLNQTI
ncbi:xylulokinase [Sediminicola luteus]|uniref:Carbohydrate kinase n=1 Tax=Sediminicola luteus TaxID=319238 RepID=A0A2A4GB17_9FLAO|nr:FGGY family carbohydrate kinase [Sediminicola luteus]PCE65797.1 carbohydrate kinase [Sediminicola luteus]